MRRVGLQATASYLPERWLSALEIGEAAGIPESVIVEKFGLRGKHIAAADEHASDLSISAAERVLEEAGVEPGEVDVVMYFGSTWKDWSVWQAAPHVAYRLGCRNAFAVEYDNVSHGSPSALRLARDLLRAEPELRTVLMVGASRESYLLDYGNERSRFAINFGDGAVAGIVRGDTTRNELLGAYTITDGSFALQVKVARGGSADPDGSPNLDVADPAVMKAGLDAVSLPNFVAVAKEALSRSGAALAELSFVCPLHMKRSMFEALLGELGLEQDQASYLDDTGHMSGVDSLFGLDRIGREGRLAEGDLVLLLSAGDGIHVGRLRRALGGSTMNIADLRPGLEAGPSSWVEVTQQLIDDFARTTGDMQPIHVDRELAAAGPFGTTVAHGFLTLSLLTAALFELLPVEGAAVVNYGVNRVRFPAPVPAGARIRATVRIESVELIPDGIQAVIASTAQRERGEQAAKPVCVAEHVLRYLG